MKFGILTYHSTDEEYMKLAALSLPNKIEFCHKWGYSLYRLTDQECKLDPYYCKYETLIAARSILLDSNIDWLWVLDIDTVITNMLNPLNAYIDNNYHFIISCDFNEINAGSYFVRNSEEGKNFLNHIIHQFPIYCNHYGREQQAIIDNVINFANIIKIVPQKIINAYEYDLYADRYPKAKQRIDRTGNNGEWDQSSLLIHFPDTTGDLRMNLIKKYLERIQR